MDLKQLKQIILEQDKIEYILNEIGCKNIERHDTYYSCSNPDGDNKTAINQYFNSEYLNCINHTRDIRYSKNNDNATSLIDLVCFIKKLNLFQVKKYLCDILGLDYYSMENEDDVPESIKMLQMLYDMEEGDFEEEDVKLQPINEKILSYYKPYVNDMFYNDNISYEVQKEFGIGYDDESNCITIPIYDEIGSLVGIKGRYFDYEIEKNKYVYLVKCAKGKILYGLHKAINFIRKYGVVYVGESEKFVLQMYSMGIYNCVSTGGKKITRQQKKKLSSLGVKVIFCYDKDVTKEELYDMTNNMENIYMVIDKDNILNKKESPSDNKEKWEQLKNNLEKIR